MIASPERIHANHVYAPLRRGGPRPLKAAVLYGPNASGKSNFVHAIEFLKRLVTQGTKAEAKIPVQRFKLDPECSERPTTLGIEFETAGEVFRYEVKFTPTTVRSELLERVRPRSTQLLFKRSQDPDGSHDVVWGPGMGQLSSDDRQFLDFVARGTRPNQLLLKEAEDRNVKMVKPLVRWFREVLTVIRPTAQYAHLEIRMSEDRPFKEFVSDLLQAAGTGIDGIETVEIPLDSHPEFPTDELDEIREHLDSDASVFLSGPEGQRFSVRMVGDEVKAMRLQTVHRATCGGEGTIAFEVKDESDGTQRLFDLAPAIFELTGTGEPRTYIVDEVDRSLHPHLVRFLFELHLDANPKGKTQLIATTHDTALLDLDLLRRDEIWFVEKDKTSATQLFSLHEFGARHDKDVSRDYLVGRYGAVPLVGDVGALTGATSSDL